MLEKEESWTKVIGEIERLCSEDVGRNIGRMAASSRGGMEKAARSLALSSPGRVAIATGCYIPSGEPPSAETDGPIGTVVLARVLQAIGHQVMVLTDPHCVRVVRAAFSAIDDWLDPVPIGILTSTTPSPVFVDGDAPDLSLTHLVSIERLGPSDDGHIRSIAGDLRDDV